MAAREDCFISADNLEVERLLEEWRWLIGNGAFSLWCVTALGNMFLRGEEGHIYFLNSTDGTFERVADSEEQLKKKLNDRANRRRWLMPSTIELLHREKVFLQAGQCYSWKTPLHLGGDAGTGNVEVADILVHVSVLGQLHRQTRHLPRGTPVKIQVEVPKRKSLWERLRSLFSAKG
jgi:hypothetical protein